MGKIMVTLAMAACACATNREAAQPHYYDRARRMAISQEREDFVPSADPQSSEVELARRRAQARAARQAATEEADQQRAAYIAAVASTNPRQGCMLRAQDVYDMCTSFSAVSVAAGMAPPIDCREKFLVDASVCSGYPDSAGNQEPPKPRNSGQEL